MPPGASVRMTRTLVPQHVYLQVELETASPAVGVVRGFADAAALEAIVSAALLDSFGVAGSAKLSVDVAQYGGVEGTSILRVAARHVQDVWAALTLVAEVHGKPARVVVSRATPFLLALTRQAPAGSLA
jgi:RNase P/RNase MRP subunit POP5